MSLGIRTLLVGTALCAALSVRAATEDPEPLRIGVPWPSGSKGMTDLRAAARRVTRQTEGRVRIRFVEQGALETEEGLLDGALLGGAALTRHSPTSRLFAIPLLFRSAEEVALVRRGADPRIGAELRERGLEPLALLDGGFAYLHATAPIDTVAQFKAARLWVPPADPELLRMAREHGMNLVPMETGEVAAGLQEQRIDAVIAPPLLAILMQWHPRIRHVANTPFLCVYFAVVLRAPVLAGLAEADRTVLREELSAAFAAAARETRDKEPEALRVLEQNGAQVRPLGGDDERRAEWNAWTDALAEQLLREGHLPREPVEEAQKALAETRGR